MRTLTIPGHMPMNQQMDYFIRTELRGREVHSVKVENGRLVIQHQPLPGPDNFIRL